MVFIDGWENYQIENAYQLYDLDGIANGYVFIITNGLLSGYLTVSTYNEVISVLEATNDSEFAFYDQLVEGKKLSAVSPLIYVEHNNLNGRGTSFVNLINGKEISVDELSSIDIKYSDAVKEFTSNVAPATVSSETLVTNSAGIQLFIQGFNQCTPSAAATLLRYYNTRSGFGGITKSLTNPQLQSSLVSIMGTPVSIAKYMEGMHTFLASPYTGEYDAWTTDTDPTIAPKTIAADGVTYGWIYKMTAASSISGYSIYQTDINANRPMMLMIGKIMDDSLGKHVIHSVVGYGYATISESSYVVVCDPLGTVKKYLRWDAIQDVENFGLYAMIRSQFYN